MAKSNAKGFEARTKATYHSGNNICTNSRNNNTIKHLKSIRRLRMTNLTMIAMIVFVFDDK